MRIAALLSAVACATLAACSTIVKMGPLPFASTQKCDTANCTVEVTVTAHGTACKLSASDVLDLRAGPASRTISWKIVTAGYEFSRENYKWGIFIKDDPGDEFKNAQITGGGDTLTLKFDKRATGITYEYALSARRSSGTKAFCETLDPWLIT